MNCPNCREKNISRKKCRKCGINMPVFFRSLKISARFYNRALIKARSFEFYEAITLLENSIKFDKKNIQARNLLGLLYYEVGRVGDALKQWILSQKMSKKNNLASYYLKRSQEEAEFFQYHDDAVNLYNKAIFCIDDGDKEKALEYLHEATTINPKFIEAMNLISLIYISRKENALPYIQKVLSIDKTNKIALHYEKFLRPTAKQESKKTVQNKQQEPPRSPVKHPHPYEPPKRRIISFVHFLTFFIGAASVAAGFYLLIMPGMLEDAEISLETLRLDFSQTIELSNDNLSSKAGRIEELQEENETLRSSLNDLEQRIEIYENAHILQNARDLNQAGDVEAAATILLNLDMNRISPDMRQEASALRSATFASATMSFYNRGRDYFNAGNYNEARNNLEQSLQFSSPGQTHRDDVIYFLGRIFEIFGQYEQALESFNRILSEHPNSNMENLTQAAISRVQEAQTRALLAEFDVVDSMDEEDDA